jgi:hypothetical protein
MAEQRSNSETTAQRSLTASHTPAPWHEDVGSLGCDIVGHQTLIATIAAYDDPEGRANARLIASAPELLTALKGLIAWQRESSYPVPLVYLERARQAVAKAEKRQ